VLGELIGIGENIRRRGIHHIKEKADMFFYAPARRHGEQKA
jgi:hypothetical protein